MCVLSIYIHIVGRCTVHTTSNSYRNRSRCEEAQFRWPLHTSLNAETSGFSNLSFTMSAVTSLGLHGRRVFQSWCAYRQAWFNFSWFFPISWDLCWIMLLNLPRFLPTTPNALICNYDIYTVSAQHKTATLKRRVLRWNEYSKCKGKVPPITSHEGPEG